jgi:hypothetical protein
VFGVLADGWLYPSWVVGAARIRAVDDTWPAAGASIHHSVGSWPLLLDDSTTVQEFVPDERIVLRARAWPAGEADVEITVRALPDGCEVTISEDAVSGPGRFVPGPVRHPALHWRNTETLRRLAFLAEGAAREPDQTSSHQASVPEARSSSR